MKDIPTDNIETYRCVKPDPDKDPTLLYCWRVPNLAASAGTDGSEPAATVSKPEQSGTGAVAKPAPETLDKAPEPRQGEFIAAHRVLINGEPHLKILGPDGESGTATTPPQQSSPDIPVVNRRFSRLTKCGCPVNPKAKNVQEPGNTSVKPDVKNGGGG